MACPPDISTNSITLSANVKVLVANVALESDEGKSKTHRSIPELVWRLRESFDAFSIAPRRQGEPPSRRQASRQESFHYETVQLISTWLNHMTIISLN